jgi:hypothetical protein
VCPSAASAAPGGASPLATMLATATTIHILSFVVAE